MKKLFTLFSMPYFRLLISRIGYSISLNCILCTIATADMPPQPVWLIDIQGGIGPATAEHVVRGITQANEQQATLVLLRIDTPGGLDSATRIIIKAILASSVPVASYVAPRGARAASAGTYILYASHIAAMAPATNVGAATPIPVGGLSFPNPEQTKESDKAGKPAAGMEKKIVNDAASYIEGLAKLRNRNAEWAIAAVKEAKSISAEQALDIGVIDLLADNETQLLRKLEGFTFSQGDIKQTLSIGEAAIFIYQPDWRIKFLAVITDPSFAYILLMVGIYGLILEISNPGALIPGVVGAISLLVAFYAFHMLPINYVGIALILLGIGLMVAEALAPSFGVLGIGGIIAFVMGSIVLMDTDIPGFQIALPLILAFASLGSLSLIIVLTLFAKMRGRIPVSGVSTMLGQSVSVENTLNNQPKVRINGELWQVSCDSPLHNNDQVKVTAVNGTLLDVKKLTTGEQQ